MKVIRNVIFIINAFLIVFLLFTCSNNLKKGESVYEKSASKISGEDRSKKIGETKVVLPEEKKVIAINKKFFGDDVYVNPEYRKGKTEAFVVKFSRGISFSADLYKEHGISVGDVLPDNGFILKGDIDEIRKIKGIEEIIPYEPYIKFSSDFGDLKQWRKARVRLWEESDAEWFRDYCKSKGFEILSKSGRNFVVKRNSSDNEAFKSLVFEEKVMRIEKYIEPEVFSFTGEAVAKALSPVYYSDYFGERVVGLPVAVFDVGVDENCEDLRGVIKGIFDVAFDGDSGEFVSHGTHISGIIAGRGNNSGGRLKGVNPATKLDFYAMGDSLKGLVVPSSMRGLFMQAVNRKTYIANLSWGTYDPSLKGSYLSISRDIDEFVYEIPEFIVVTAVGNNGKSIASPATAKNVIAVGALEGNEIATYSGRNNAKDGRTKPDFWIQGSSINGPGLNNTYTTLNGTSQATAILSGIISKLGALLKERFGVSPTHSVVKAFLAASSPDNDEGKFGFGRVYFPTILDALHYRVVWNKGMVDKISIYLKKGDRVSASLCWTDPPAFESSIVQLIDDFDLEITTPSGKKLTKNDSINNIEKLVFEVVEAGKYTFEVKSRFVPLPVYDMSVVVRSYLGFGSEEKPMEEEKEQVADVQGTGSESGSSTSVTTEQNTGISSGSEGTGYNAGSDVSYAGGESSGSGVSSQDTVSSDAGAGFGGVDLSAFENKDIEEEEVSILYCKSGRNDVAVRVLGADTNKTVGITIHAGDNSSEEKFLPVSSIVNGKYQYLLFDYNITNNEKDAQLLVQREDNITDYVDVVIRLDNEPPFVKDSYPGDSYPGDSYPLSNQVLTNSYPWVDIVDSGSGMDDRFVIAVNGKVLGTNDFEYNYGTGRMLLRLDRVMLLTNRVRVNVDFMSVKDLVGNSTNWSWSFIYDGEDRDPPDSPKGLCFRATNKIVELEWLPNEEKDLWGYRVYRVNENGLLEKLSAGVISTNYYKFFSTGIERVAVSAIDISSNESEPSFLDINYKYRGYPPEIFITGVPEVTNGSVKANIFIMDEGIIIETNVLLNNKPAYVSWKSNYGVLNIEESGEYTLFVSVMDDDTNVATNSVSFKIDKEAPLPVSGITWEQELTNLKLSWLPVKKGERECRYNVFLGGNEILSGIETNFALINFDDLGKYTIGVQAVDDLGNRGEVKYVVIDMEKGIEIKNIPALVRDRFLLNADVLISTNKYEYIMVSLSNKGFSKSWRLSRDYSIDRGFDINGIPDGDYNLGVSARDSSDRIYVNNFGLFREALDNRNITVDQSLPEIYLIVAETTNNANAVFVSTNLVKVFVDDLHFEMAHASVNGGEFEFDSYSPEFSVSIEKDSYLEIMGMDKAGNKGWKTYTIYFDNIKPEITNIRISNSLVSGRIYDKNLLGFDVYVDKGLFYHSDVGVDGVICKIPNKDMVLKIVAYDRVGNTNEYIQNVKKEEGEEEFLADVLINGSTNFYYDTGNISVGYIGKLDSLKEYILYEGGKIIFSSGFVESTNYAIEGLKDGFYSIGIKSGDLFKYRDFVIDTTSPYIRFRDSVSRGTGIKDVAEIVEQNLDRVDYVLNGIGVDEGYILNEYGSYNVEITAFDKVGHVSKNSNLIRIIPTVTEYFPAHFKNLKGGEFYNSGILLEIEESYDSIVYKDNGREIKGNRLEIEGGHLVEVEAKRVLPFTNIIYTNSIFVTLDFTPPVIYCSYEDGKIYNTLPIILINDPNLEDRKIMLDGNEWDGRSIPEGRHSFKMDATDKAGNKSSKGLSFTFDSIPPSLSVLPESGYYRSVLPKFSAVDSGGLKEVYFYTNNYLCGSNVVIKNEGKTLFRVIAMDTAGNETNIEREYIIDTTSPLIIANVKEGEYCLTNFRVAINYEDANFDRGEVYLNGKEYDGNPIKEEGNYKLEVKAFDKAGNSALTNINFYVKKDIPVIVMKGLEGLVFISNTGYYTDRKVNLSISVTNGEVLSLSVMVNGVKRDNVVSLTEDGVYNIDVNSDVNLNGSVYRLNKSERIIIDTKPPYIVIKGVEDKKNYSSNVTVTVEAGDYIKANSITLNGVLKDTNIINISKDGSYTLEVNVADYLNRKKKDSLGFTIDREQPVVKIEGFENGEYLTNCNYRVIVSDANLKSQEILLNGEEVASSGNLVHQGTNYFEIRAEDVANNMVVTNLFCILDKTPPEIKTFPDLIDEYTRNYEGEIIFKEDTSLASAYVQIYRKLSNVMIESNVYCNSFDDGKREERFSLNLTEEGEYFIDVQLENMAGAIAKTNWNIVVDKTPPAFVRFECPDSYTTSSGRFVQQAGLNVEVFDTYRGTAIIITNRGDNAWGIIAYNTNKFSTNMMKEGFYDFEVKVVDRAGNMNVASRSFTIDNTPPVLGFNPEVKSIAGIWTNSNVNIALKTVEKNLDYCDITNYWQLSPSEGYRTYLTINKTENNFNIGITNDGENIIYILAKDKANNFTTTNFSFYLDKLPPSIVQGIQLRYGKYINTDVDLNEFYRVEDNLKFSENTFSSNATLEEKEGEEWNIRELPADRLLVNEGYYRYSLSVTDRAQNTAFKTNEIFIDKTPPVSLYSGVSHMMYTNKNFVFTNTFTDEWGEVDITRVTNILEISNMYDYDPVEVISSRNPCSFTVSNEGMYRFSGIVYDKAGNFNSDQISFCLDKTAPTLSFSNVAYDSIINKGELVILTNDNLSGIRDFVVSNYYSGGSRYLGSRTGYTIGSSDITSEGTNIILVTAVDRAGNVSEAGFRFILDKTCPVVRVFSNEYRNSSIVELPHDIGTSGRKVTVPVYVSDIYGLKRINIKQCYGYTTEPFAEWEIADYNKTNYSTNVTLQYEDIVINDEVVSIIIEAEDIAGNIITVTYRVRFKCDNPNLYIEFGYVGFLYELLMPFDKRSTGCSSATIQKNPLWRVDGHCHHLSFPQVLLKGRAAKM